MTKTDQLALSLVEQACGALRRAEELLPGERVSRAPVSRAYADAIRAVSAVRHDLLPPPVAARMPHFVARAA